MAYADINEWARMMAEEEDEVKAYDEACRASARRSRELDEKEFDELDEDEIDPKTLGITDSEAEDQLEAEEIEDSDEIDFDAYMTDEDREEEARKELLEADDRELLTKIARLLGKTASTTNLTGQDSVCLNEADEKAAEAIDDLGSGEDFAMTSEEAEQFDAFPKTMRGLRQRVEFLKGLMKGKKLSAAGKANLQAAIDQYQTLFDDLSDKPSPTGFSRQSDPVEVTVPAGYSTDFRRAFHKGEDAEERSNETGLDAEVDYKHANWSPEPDAPGTRRMTQFNPDYVSPVQSKQKAYQTTQTDAWKQAVRTAKQQQKTGEAGKVAREQLMSKEEKIDVFDFAKILNGIPKAERDELMSDLMASAANPNEKNFIRTIFTDPRKIQQKDLNAAKGGGSDQKGRTGMGTENVDKSVNMILTVLCEYWLPQDDKTVDLVQRFRKNLRSENTARRQARIELRPRLLGMLMDEFGDMESVPQPYAWDEAAGKMKPNLAEKKRFNKKVCDLYVRTVGGRDVPDEDVESIRNAVRNFERADKVVKSKNMLGSIADKARFQELIAKGRRDPEGVTDGEWVEMLKLNLMRLGRGEEQAEEIANRVVENPDPEYLKSLKLDDKLVKAFLRGGSANSKV